jgi:hypothetical protein
MHDVARVTHIRYKYDGVSPCVTATDGDAAVTSTRRVKRHQRRRRLGWVCLPPNIRVRPEVIDAVLENLGMPPGSYDRDAVRRAFELDFANLVRCEPPEEE